MATSGGNFNAPPTSGTTTFRMLQSTRVNSTSPTKNLSDATTDAGGGTIQVAWGAAGPTALNMTLGNSALGVTNLALPLATTVVNGTEVRQVTLADGRVLTVRIETAFNSTTDFSWTAYGGWAIASSGGVAQNSGTFVSGFETPLGGKPTSGSATFNGFLEGFAYKPSGTALLVAQLLGSVQLVANWATGGITGTASSITANPFPLNSSPLQTWNGLSFSGNITSGTTAFSGTTTATGNPGTNFAVTTGATGGLNGQFFGTTAQEFGAIWSVHDGTNGANGLIVGKQ